MEDYYSLLGVPRDASDEVIRRAYRRRAKLAHPDLRPGAESERLMRQLNVARDTLLDPAQRRSYDLRSVPGVSKPTATTRDGFDVHASVTLTAQHAARGGHYERIFHGPDGRPYTLRVVIPPGVVGGSQLRVRGAGVRGLNGGRDGDFVLTVWVGA